MGGKFSTEWLVYSALNCVVKVGNMARTTFLHTNLSFVVKVGILDENIPLYTVLSIL